MLPNFLGDSYKLDPGAGFMQTMSGSGGVLVVFLGVGLKSPMLGVSKIDKCDKKKYF